MPDRQSELIIQNGKILSDEIVVMLAKQAIVQAETGADDDRCSNLKTEQTHCLEP
ncbi:MAG: hypothetical protein HC780_19955 [Leptolyngbyaceae cyanobacterium CSU_1_3]|nr:hypothetical protein [Leptolyngbyaceae cyanobacterium CSU_1_3]